ncbi:MAG: DUF885 domain-containing protein [Planctomycetota bacterium]|jgi:prolyl oligopeptidase
MADSPSSIHQLAEDVWDYQMEESPTWCTFTGDRRFDDRLHEIGPEARDRQKSKTKAFLARLDETDVGDEEEDRITADVLRQKLTDDLEGFEHPFWEWDCNQLIGLHVHLQDMLSYHPLGDEKGARDLLSRFQQVPQSFEALAEDLRLGLHSGRVMPNVALERVMGQFERFLATEPAETTFGKTVSSLPDTIEQGARETLQADLMKSVVNDVVPAFRHFHGFLEREYAGNARDGVGVMHIPGGKEAYTWRARSSTTTDLTPEQIHEIGLEELEKNREEMLEIAKRNGHDGDLRSYLDKLSNDPAFRLSSREEILERYDEILARMDKALPEAFGMLPQTPYEVRPMPAFKEKDAPAAYYYPPDDSGERPGIFFANLHKPESWPTYEMETLSFHEAVPGHHLQIAIAVEQKHLPRLRRRSHYTAYIEGWAHYTERLADEMEMFSADEDVIGMLAGQAWRAARLVVDTGMHYLGWTREQAVELLKSIKTGPDGDIDNEIDRYIVWPGQALAYKVGHRRISEARDRAKGALGDAFDLRGFHDEVLKHGALPLSVMDACVDRWVDRVKAG